MNVVLPLFAFFKLFQPLGTLSVSVGFFGISSSVGLYWLIKPYLIFWHYEILQTLVFKKMVYFLFCALTNKMSSSFLLSWRSTGLVLDFLSSHYLCFQIVYHFGWGKAGVWVGEFNFLKSRKFAKIEIKLIYSQPLLPLKEIFFWHADSRYRDVSCYSLLVFLSYFDFFLFARLTFLGSLLTLLYVYSHFPQYFL